MISEPSSHCVRMIFPWCALQCRDLFALRSGLCLLLWVCWRVSPAVGQRVCWCCFVLLSSSASRVCALWRGVTRLSLGRGFLTDCAAPSQTDQHSPRTDSLGRTGAGVGRAKSMDGRGKGTIVRGDGWPYAPLCSLALRCSPRGGVGSRAPTNRLSA
jgi:hypothetical protein